MHRIVFAKDTHVGSWYPLSSDGRIHDAKTATVAGAALNQAVRSGLIPHWRIKRSVSPYLPKRNYWGLMPQAGRRDFGAVYLNQEDDTKVCRMLVGSHIGRRLFPAKTRPEPVYVLRWADPARYRRGDAQVSAALHVTLQRVVPEATGLADDSAGSHLPAGEHLTISAVEGEYDGKPVHVDDLELGLCTIDSDEYWMDACIFHPEWPEQKR